VLPSNDASGSSGGSDPFDVGSGFHNALFERPKSLPLFLAIAAFCRLPMSQGSGDTPSYTFLLAIVAMLVAKGTARFC
jgi:hypothetical protein